MTFMIERRTPVYSVTQGDQVVWRKVRDSKGRVPLEWGTEREAKAFADLFFVSGAKTDLRIVEIFNADA